MAIQIVYTVEVTDERRRAIAALTGGRNMASRAEVRAWYMRHGTSRDAELQAASGGTEDERG